EAVPLAVAALLPVVLFPLLGVRTAEEAAAPYADPVVFLFLGGFMLALAMQRWGLHRRIALTIIRAMGTRPAGLVGGFMAATAFISMWVNNTATVLMMLPIGLSVVELVERCEADEPRFPPALLLGIVYASAIGGLGTLIGTPPNALLAGFLASAYGVEIGFLRWMLVGVPLVAVLLPLAWLLLTRLVLPLGRREIPGGRELIAREIAGLGPVSRAEWTVAAVFVLTDLLWIGRPWIAGWAPGLSDAGIALGAAVLLFVLPAARGGGGRVLDWDTAGRLPWDVLLLFGGGLSLADGIAESGLAAWIGDALSGLGGLPLLGIAVAVALVLVALSEVASNTAAAVTFLPVIASLAVGMGQGPVLLATVAVLAASGGFVLPVASPPNAIVYGTGRVTLAQMVRGGLVMDAVFALALPVLAVALVRLFLPG
ncbi:MAG: DASS family sodium-coupled anion symporter, partial [Gemmatimonadota bacterium]